MAFSSSNIEQNCNWIWCKKIEIGVNVPNRKIVQITIYNSFELWKSWEINLKQITFTGQNLVTIRRACCCQENKQCWNSAWVHLNSKGSDYKKKVALAARDISLQPFQWLDTPIKLMIRIIIPAMASQLTNLLAPSICSIYFFQFCADALQLVVVH